VLFFIMHDIDDYILYIDQVIFSLIFASIFLLYDFDGDRA
jgi:hypothetical protein